MRGVFLAEEEVNDLADYIEYQHRIPQAAERLTEWVDYLRGRTQNTSPYTLRQQRREEDHE